MITYEIEYIRFKKVCLVRRVTSHKSVLKAIESKRDGFDLNIRLIYKDEEQT